MCGKWEAAFKKEGEIPLLGLPQQNGAGSRRMLWEHRLLVRSWRALLHRYSLYHLFIEIDTYCLTEISRANAKNLLWFWWVFFFAVAGLVCWAGVGFSCSLLPLPRFLPHAERVLPAKPLGVPGLGPGTGTASAPGLEAGICHAVCIIAASSVGG